MNAPTGASFTRNHRKPLRCRRPGVRAL